MYLPNPTLQIHIICHSERDGRGEQDKRTFKIGEGERRVKLGMSSNFVRTSLIVFVVS